MKSPTRPTARASKKDNKPPPRRKSIGETSTSESKQGRRSIGEPSTSSEGRKSVKRDNSKMAPPDCLICSIPISNENGIVCGLCHETVCRRCSDIADDQEWAILKRRKTSFFQCNICVRRGTLVQLQNMQQTLDKIEGKVDEQAKLQAESKMQMEEMVHKIDTNAQHTSDQHAEVTKKMEDMNQKIETNAAELKVDPYRISYSIFLRQITY